MLLGEHRVLHRAACPSARPGLAREGKHSMNIPSQIFQYSLVFRASQLPQSEIHNRTITVVLILNCFHVRPWRCSRARPDDTTRYTHAHSRHTAYMYTFLIHSDGGCLARTRRGFSRSKTHDCFVELEDSADEKSAPCDHERERGD